MLWTERYRPVQFGEILGQEPVIQHLTSFAASGTIPHLLLSGPHGTGKSVAIECFARSLYGEDWELNTSVFQTADIFLQGKAFLEQDERYTHLYQKSQSLINNFKYILKEYASMRPFDTPFKLLVFEDAHALSRDAQQALRRIMERYSQTCRFVFTTKPSSALIPAITSRCLPLFFSPVGPETVLLHLSSIRGRETGCGYSCSDDDLELIVQAARGDLRRGILLLQLALETGKCGELLIASQSETANIAASALMVLREGDMKHAMRQLESLMIDYGLSGDEVFSELRNIIQREYNDPALAITLAEAEHRLKHANNEYLQVSAFASSVRDVFP